MTKRKAWKLPLKCPSCGRLMLRYQEIIREGTEMRCPCGYARVERD